MRKYSPRTMSNGQQATDEFKLTVVKHHLSHNMGAAHTAKFFGISATAVRNWIAIFADGNNTQQPSAMKQTNEEPKSINMDELSSCTAEEQIAKLKEALRRAELRADLYDEMINVAEAKFKVGIRKKAGAKQ